MATATGVAVATRMAWQEPLWAAAAWYVGGFVGFHLCLVPPLAAWFGVTDVLRRWIRGIVEEELIRYDLQTYQKQLQRVFPHVEPPRPRQDELRP